MLKKVIIQKVSALMQVRDYLNILQLVIIACGCKLIGGTLYFN